MQSPFAAALRPAPTPPRRGATPTAATPGRRLDRGRVAATLTAAGAACLVLEGGVHLQQLVEIFHTVEWIGPLFGLNAAACALATLGVLPRRTRTLASICGALISLGALVSLALSYTVGLFGWFESGLRTPIALAIVSEVGAVAALGGALVATHVGRRDEPA
jgi:hypothetical protein